MSKINDERSLVSESVSSPLAESSSSFDVSDFSSVCSSSVSCSFDCSACCRFNSSFSSFKRATSSLSSFSEDVSGSSVLQAVRIKDNEINNKYFFTHFIPFYIVYLLLLKFFLYCVFFV